MRCPGHCLLVLLSFSITNQFEESNSSEEVVRGSSLYRGNIPPHIQPLTYSIGLIVDLKNWAYSGRTQVLINITEPCDQIPIHSVGLNITDVFVATFDNMVFGRRVTVSEVLEDPAEELLRIYPRYLIQPGLHILIVDFKNNFAEDSFWGFYKSSWQDEEGWENRMVTTQFSPYWARTAWPCYDEPRFKARFKFFVEHESKYDALSNAALVSREPLRAGWVRSTFDWTPPMSSYITAIIVTNYRYIESKTSLGIPTRVYGSWSAVQNSKQQLDDLTQTLDFFTDYFGVDYAMEKLYLVPIKKIGVAAMENWGLITAREDIANYNPKIHGAQWELQKRIVLTHEVAHMWFGNLVTQEWWDNIILKESTVQWFMVYAAGELFDDFDFADEYTVLNDLIRGMDKDSSVHSRPALYAPETQGGIMDLFDEITYSRGGIIFRMVYHIIGQDAFKNAIHNYLAEKAYRTANMGDMVKYFQQATDDEYNIADLVDRFTMQKNFPLVHVRMLNRTHVLVTQERFLYSSKDALNDSPFNYTWHIPFTYTTDTERNDQVVILTEKENVVKLRKPATWIKANNDFRMYYITNYDLVGWKKLYHQLINNHTVFTTTDRMQLLSDLLNLVTADRLDITFPLMFLTYMRSEREYGPWKIATTHWNRLMTSRMSPAEKFAAKIYARNLLDEALKEVVQYDISYTKPLKQRLMQFLLVDAALKVDHPLAEDFIKQLGDNPSVTNEDTVDPDMAYLTKLKRAMSDRKYWVELFRSLPGITDTDQLYTTYQLLCSSQDQKLLMSVIESSMNATNKEDAMIQVLELISVSEPDLVWTYFKKNYKIYFQTFGESQFIMAELVRIVTENLSSQASYKEVTNFFEINDPGAGQPGVLEGLERISDNIRWKQNHRHKCRTFFFTYARKHAKRSDPERN